MNEKNKAAFEESLATWNSKGTRIEPHDDFDLSLARFFFFEGAAYGVKALGQQEHEIEVKSIVGEVR